MIDKPAGLRKRGTALWSDLSTLDSAPAELVLLAEACRIADRLDKLDRLLTGGAADWIALVERKGHPDLAEIVVDKALTEARQQALALKAIVAELRMQRAERPARASGVGTLAELAAAAPGVVDLSAERTARRP